MARPTILQTLFNRPSQSYVLPQDQSNHRELAPIVTPVAPRRSGRGDTLVRPPIHVQGSPTTHVDSPSHASLSSTKHSTPSSAPPRLNLSAAQGPVNSAKTPIHRDQADSDEDDEDDGESSSQDVFYTPNSSPRASIASSPSIHMSFAASAATTTPRKVSRRSLRNKTPPPPDQFLGKSAHEPNKPDLAPPSTPLNNNLNTTANNSMAASTNANAAITPTGAASSPAPSPARIAVPSTRTPSRSNSLNKGRPAPNARSTLDPGPAEPPQGRSITTASMVSTGSSMSSNSLDGHSIFSDLLTETTGATTALPDGNGAKNEHATRRWVDKGGRYPSGGAAKATTTPAAPSITQPRRKPTKAHTYHGLGVPATTTSSTFTAPNLHQRYQHQQQQRNRDKHTSSVMMSMTAVLEAAEEDELSRSGQENGGFGSPAWKAKQLLKQHKDDGRKVSAAGGYGAAGTSKAAPRGSRERNRAATFQVLDGEHSERGRERRGHSSQYAKHQPITSSPLSAPSKPGTTSSKQQFLQVSTPSRPRLGHRRSRSLGADGKSTLRRSDSPTTSHRSRTTLLRSGSPARSHGRAHSVSLGAATAAAEISALPKSSGELPSNGTAGYTSLVLPRAPPPLNLDHSNPYRGAQGKMGGGLMGAGEGRVDLTKNGMAQTTMASVEVVRGLGSVAGRKGLLMGILPLVRRKTVPDKLDLTGRARRSEDQAGDGAHALAEGVVKSGGPTLGFTSYRKPPEYVPSGSVLVQVWAVGVDGVDGRLVGVRMLHGVRAPPVPAAPAPATSVGKPTVLQNEEGPAVVEVGQEQTLEAEEGAEKSQVKAKGLGLGRSLSLRERLSRSVSLGRSAGKASLQQRRQRQHSPDKQQSPPSSQLQSPENDYTTATTGGGTVTAVASVGYIPGRSFVGRVVECGWEVRGEVVRKGEWVAGLLDVRKCGALTEFIIVDRHRIHRVPHPNLEAPSGFSPPTFSPSSPSTSSVVPTQQHSLSLEELALLPLCGVPAYRAVRTFTYAFSSMRDNLSSSSVGGAGVSDKAKNRATVGVVDPHPPPLNLAAYGTMFSRLNLGDHENGRRRRALVLRGHDGMGAMAVQMLVLRGWRVCVHVPFIASPPNVPTTSAVADRFMEEVEERIRKWGAEEVIFDDGEVVGVDEGRRAVARVMDGLKDDGDVFDAVLDTVGGKVVREAAERLLRSPGRSRGGPDPNGNGNGLGKNGKGGMARPMGQFTTVVGDNPERAIPSAGDLFRAGLRSLKFGGGGGTTTATTTTSAADAERGGGSSENLSVQNNNGKGGKVGYAWVNISQDVDWEGKDVGETIGSVVDLALEYGVKPWVGAEFATTNGVGAGGRGTMASTATGMPAESAVAAVEQQPLHWEGRRTVPFEKVPEVFVDGGPLSSGGTVVVRIAA